MYDDPNAKTESDRHLLDFVDDYLYGVLTKRQEVILERHVAECKICQVALEEARKRQSAMLAAPAADVSEELIHRTVDRVKADKSWPAVRITRIYWSAVAVAATVLLGLSVYFATLKPTPYDLTVLGQTQLLSGSEATLRLLLVNRSTGEPVAKAPLAVRLINRRSGESVQLASVESDAAGGASPRMALPEWPSGDYQLEVRARAGGREEVVSQPIKLRRSWQLMLSTDKPVYQPGQVIRLRSLALRRPDLKPVAGENVEYSISDPKGNVVFRKKDVTSRYGIAATDCALATEIIEGPYQVRCQLGDTQSKITVDVHKYVLPKFNVQLTLDRPYYEPGQMVRGTVMARYFFGKPVAKGSATISLDVPPGTGQNAPSQPGIPELSVETDEQGKGTFAFRLPDALAGREQDSGDRRLPLVATVRDSAGQEQRARASCVVTTQPIRIEVMPESGVLVPGMENQVYLLTTYADGRPAVTTIAVTGQQAELKTSSLGVAILKLTPNSGAVSLTLRATDSDGVIGRRQANFALGQAADDFIVRTDKSVYTGGETMLVTVLGGGREPMFVDMIKDGQTMRSDRVEVSGGQGAAAIDLPSELFGTLELCAYRFNRTGQPVRKTRLLYVRPAARLAVDAKLDRSEYRPGEKAKLRLTLKDQKGQPKPGAISLAAVDEAVFAVRADRPGTEQAFFTVEQELLNPVYAIYPWSPEFGNQATSQERIDFEQALFCGTQERANRAGTTSPHTLNFQSYPGKEQSMHRHQWWMLNRMRSAWFLLGAVVVTSALVQMWRAGARSFAAGVVILLVLASLIMSFGGCSRGDVEFLGGAKSARQEMHNDLSAKSDATPSPAKPDADAAEPPRVRQWFPETLLWRPEIITDDQGVASIDVELADSITDWRLSASAVSADGQLGGSQNSIRVFQPFFVDLNLPVALTRGDEVSVPAVVYNYLDKSQTVRLTLDAATWFERLGEAEQSIELPAGAVKSVYFRVRAKQVGTHELQVTAHGGNVADAIKRQIEVEPDGRRIDQVSNGALQDTVSVDVAVPADAIPGSVHAIVKLYPGSFSQLVEGLDGIFRQPYGCFEQTSSTTYPNVLALDYLRRTGKSVPEVEAKARQYVHLGYQRLLSFEVAGGGFDWFGRSPANRTLTAYGLMEFQDMARVHDIDPKLIARTRQWLLTQQKGDGSWDPEGHMLHEDPTRGSANGTARLSTTAYIAWAALDGGSDPARADASLRFLQSHRPDSIESPYVLALVSNALLAVDASGGAAQPYLDRLESLKQISADGKLVWWGQRPNERTTFYGAGQGGGVETTATAALALLRANRHPSATRGALAWLVTQRDGNGTWHTTQGTVMALKALIAGTGKSLGGNGARTVEVAVDGQPPRVITIAAEQFDVVHQLDLSAQVAEGTHRISLSHKAGDAPGYQIAVRYHVPGAEKPAPKPPLSIAVNYGKLELRVDDTVPVAVSVTNNLAELAPMVIADLPVPAGFALEGNDLDQLVKAGTIAKFQVTPRKVIIYLRGLAPRETLKLDYRLRATMPVRVSTPSAYVYEYYNPDVKAGTEPVAMVVAAK